MKDCPPDAIHRSSGGEVFIADTCIGCGNCQKNCPYGVIQMAPVADKQERLFIGIVAAVRPRPQNGPIPDLRQERARKRP